MSQLLDLSQPFPDRYVQRKPGAGGGDYVTHSTVTQRLLMAVGPYSYEVVELIRGDWSNATESRTIPNAVQGALCRLTVTVDDREVSVTEVGDCENPGNWKTDGQRAKDASSDGFKRCAMRLGLGLHLWAGDQTDPPWRYASAATKADARKHYSTMDMDGIRSLPVEHLAADDAHLWLWCTNALMEDGYSVVRAWGFKPITVLTWCKPAPGVGYYLRNNTEHAIFATRGKPLVPEHKPLSTWFQWQRGAHSAKPAAFFDIVEQVSPGPRVELFCRAPRFGWDSWGHGYEGAA